MSISVPFSIVAGSTNESMDLSGAFSAKQTYRCRWSERLKLARQLLGYPSVGGIPESYPGYSSAYVQRVSNIRPETQIASTDGTDHEVPDYDYAYLDVEYSNQSQNGTGVAVDQDTGILYQERLQVVEEQRPTDSSLYFWDQGKTQPLKDGEAPTKSISLMNWTVSIPNVSSISQDFLDLSYTINNSEIRSVVNGMVFGVNHLKYNGFNSTRTVDENGNEGFTIDMFFTYRRESWQFAYRSGTPNAQQIYTLDGPRGLNANPVPVMQYEETDFTKLKLKQA